MSKHVRSALFYVLRRCGDICVKRVEERMDGGRGAETPFTACPVEMAAVIPLTETVLC